MFTVGQRLATGPRMYGDVVVLSVLDGDADSLDSLGVPAGVLRVTVECGSTYRTIMQSDLVKNCDECMAFPILVVSHNNCLYGGYAAGHSVAHCTADSCY